MSGVGVSMSERQPQHVAGSQYNPCKGMGAEERGPGGGGGGWGAITHGMYVCTYLLTRLM